MNSNKSFLSWILIAKGIGITLIVIGHFFPDDSPRYWSMMRTVIYSFHIPLFFFLSGYLYTHRKYAYGELIKNKTKRLVYPFFSIALFFLILKYILGNFAVFDHPIDFESIKALLVDPVHSYMPLLWFVHALFIIFILYPALRYLLNNNYLILIFIVSLNILGGNDYPVIGKALASMPFFITGVITRENGKLTSALTGTGPYKLVIPLIMFILIYLSRFAIETTKEYDFIAALALGILGTLFVINVSHIIADYAQIHIKLIFWEMGLYSMTIYLFHTLFESSVRIGFTQILSFSWIPFEVIACIAVAAGITFPLILEKMILRKNRYTKKYVLGLA